MININEFSKFLLDSLPEFKSKYNESLKDNDGEVLTYVIFGELTRFFINQYRKRNFELCNKIQNYLVSLLEGSDLKTDELVSFGFLENLHQAGEEYDNIKKSLDPALLYRLEFIENRIKKEDSV